MKSFRHFDARTVGEASEMLDYWNGNAKLIAGGTDLLGVLKDRIHPHYPEVLINIKPIPNLDIVAEDDGFLRVGALAKLSDVAENEAVKKRYGILAEAAKSVATPQIRNMATIGGNLCQEARCWYYRYPHQVGGRILCIRKDGEKCFAIDGDNRYHAILQPDVCVAVCPSDIATALTTLEARVKIAGVKGSRSIAVTDFFEVYGNILHPDELITEIQIPRPPEESKQKFLKFRLRDSVDFAIVSVGCLLAIREGRCEEARISLGAVAPIPIRALKAENFIKEKIVDPESAEEAGNKAVVDAAPLSMNAYKVELTKTLVKRALLL